MPIDSIKSGVGEGIHFARSDEPIKSKDEDWLNRTKFAQAISGYILDKNAPSPFAIAVNAPWGAGKSSLLNLIEESIGDQESQNKMSQTNQSIVICFNPWLFGNVEELIHEFFNQIIDAISGNSTKNKLVKEICRGLEATCELVSKFQTGTGSFASFIKPFTSKFTKDKSLTEIKNDLTQKLTELDRKVIIFIDDIDRLEPKYVMLILRMIRLALDIPYFIFVLSYDRKVVEQVIENEIGITNNVEFESSGRDYLEKIVQVTFDVPNPDESEYSKLIDNSLKKVLEEIGVNFPEDHRWDRSYQDQETDEIYEGIWGAIKCNLQTIRQIKRYFNNLRLTLPTVVNEVNLTDFIAIELIRLHYPEIYQSIANSKYKLVYDEDDLFDNNFDDQSAGDWFQSIRPYIDPKFRPSIEVILTMIFPKFLHVDMKIPFEKALKNEVNSTNKMDTDLWKSERRICSDSVFENFFKLRIPFEKISND